MIKKYLQLNQFCHLENQGKVNCYTINHYENTPEGNNTEINMLVGAFPTGGYVF